MGEVRWTTEAERWLRDIHDYIAQDSPDAALRTVQSIYDKALDLSTFPEMGQAHPTRGSQLRILLYRHYRIVYELDVDDVIHIVGVFHGALDMERYLE